MQLEDKPHQYLPALFPPAHEVALHLAAPDKELGSNLVGRRQVGEELPQHRRRLARQLPGGGQDQHPHLVLGEGRGQPGQ